MSRANIFREGLMPGALAGPGRRADFWRGDVTDWNVAYHCLAGASAIGPGGFYRPHDHCCHHWCRL